MPETGLKIRIYGDPVLRQKALPVEDFDDALREELKRMSRQMYDSDGIGLAAPQVGISRQFIVVDCGSGLYKLINPRIVSRSGAFAIEEGCLSVPGICVKVRRARKIRVKAMDEFGRPMDFIAEELLACVIQHEMDHLKGKLIVDYAPLFRKLAIKKKLEKLTSESARLCKLQL